MAYSRASFDLGGGQSGSDFETSLDLKNLGLAVRVFEPGEGFDFFHNHREQEEVYFCLSGSACLKVKADDGAIETLPLTAGEAVRVDPQTERVIGNASDAPATVLIAGACPHTYPVGLGHHGVIADVAAITGRGDTGFRLPSGLSNSADLPPEDC